MRTGFENQEYSNKNEKGTPTRQNKVRSRVILLSRLYEEKLDRYDMAFPQWPNDEVQTENIKISYFCLVKITVVAAWNMDLGEALFQIRSFV